MNSVVYLSVEQVLALHKKSLERYGGSAGLREKGLLNACVARPMQSAFGQDAYPDLFSKAAALIQAIAANHCFIDGNKRTAFISGVMFLKLNGYDLKASQKDATDFMLRIASGKEKKVADIAQWLEKHSENN